MSKGYLLFAIDGDVNYSKLAYACALSIKNTQPDGYNLISVVTNNVEYYKDKSVFDNVIQYNSVQSGMDVRSLAYDYTPYDETVLLDSDMLFLKPMNLYWDMVDNMDLYISTSPQSHRNTKFRYGYYRKMFEENHWTDVYSAWTYFKKSDSAKQFFDVVKLVTDNPLEFLPMYKTLRPMTSIPTDEAFAIAVEMLDIKFPDWDFPRITHMKSEVQGWKNCPNEWIEYLRFLMNTDGEVYTGVWKQSELLHYVNKHLITDRVITILESQL
jgi:hypothetical protein